MKSLITLTFFLLLPCNLLATDTVSSYTVSSYTDENGNTIYYNQSNASKPNPSPKTAPLPQSQIIQRPQAPVQSQTKEFRFNTPQTTPDKQIDMQALIRNENKAEKAFLTSWIKGSLMFIMLAIIIPSILWLICLIDILRSDFLGQNKVIWFLATLFLPYLGPILYFFIGLNQKRLPGIPDEFQN